MCTLHSKNTGHPVIYDNILNLHCHLNFYMCTLFPSNTGRPVNFEKKSNGASDTSSLSTLRSLSNSKHLCFHGCHTHKCCLKETFTGRTQNHRKTPTISDRAVRIRLFGTLILQTERFFGGNPGRLVIFDSLMVHFKLSLLLKKYRTSGNF